MRDNPYKRKLTVIVSADVANYARLTELNELEVHNQLRKRLELVQEYTEYHHGVVLRTHGDGCLCRFDSVINAFKAALELQQTSNLLNASLPSSSQIRFRIGVHLAEVILDNDEPYGNGVNIAVRLQQAATPGEILVSEETAQFVPQKCAFHLSRANRQTLKNISQKVYARRLMGHNIVENKTYQQSILKDTFYVVATAAVIVMAFKLSPYAITENQYQDISENRFSRGNRIIESNQYSTNEEPVQEMNALHPDLKNQLNTIAANFNHLNSEMASLQSRLNSDKESLESRLKQVNISLSRQEVLMDALSKEVDQSHYITVNAVYDDLAGDAYGYSDYLSLSNHYISQSIDSINNAESTDVEKSVVAGEDALGCLSCVSNQSAQSLAKTQPRLQRNTAIVYGAIGGDGAKRYLSKFDMLRSYMSLKVQESVKQSAFGENIEQYTTIDSVSVGDDEQKFIEELCMRDNTLLIARYELTVKAWYTEGTHLHFYNCASQKSVSYFEKQLAPTIHNVTKPYLAEDTLFEVNKSVHYMIDKLNLNRKKI